MTKICKIGSFLVLLLCSLCVQGQTYEYVKGSNRFEVVESSSSYEVICRRTNASLSSKNRNILDRQLRLDAIDLIGVYILFKEQSDLPAALFQIYVEGINLHYNAYVEGFAQKEKTIKGESCICYECNKANYKIESATYNKVLDIPSLLESHYAHNKGETSAKMMYEYEGFTSQQYLLLERDFLTGETHLPKGVRMLQGFGDRFELTVFGMDNDELRNAVKQAKQSLVEANPYKQFCCEELVTAAPLKEKAGFYKQWQQSLSPSRCVWEDVLLFCSQNAPKTPMSEGFAFSDIIASYPGAVSPFGIRQPIDGNSYALASQVYSNSNFKEAVLILKEAIDTEGISPQLLNLLGASYRFDGNAIEAVPYLLLCFKLNPNTPYLVGNIAMCLEMLKYPRLNEVLPFLLEYAQDEWSKTEINKLIHP